MIDSEFYRRVGDEGIENFYSGNLNADEVLQIVESNRSDLPHIDQLETTNNCNMRCKMCPRTEHMSRAIIGSMSDSIFTSVVDQLAEIEQEKCARGITVQQFREDPPESLLWDGSEHDIFDLRLHHFGAPFLDPKIVERVAYIQDKRERVRALFGHGLRRLIIAVDGIDAASFKDIRGRDIDYQRLVLDRVRDVVNIKRELDSDVRVEVQVIDLKGTSIPKFENIWSEEGVDVLQKSFFPYPDVASEVGNVNTEFSADCLLPFTSMVVLADGRVVPCCADYNGEEVIGDVKKDSLVDIWNGPKFAEFREKFVRASFSEDSLCRRCGAYPF